MESTRVVSSQFGVQAWGEFKVAVKNLSDFSRSLKVAKLTLKCVFAVFNALSVLAYRSVYKKIAVTARQLRTLITWLEGSRSLNDLLNEGVSWHKGVYSAAGLILTFFTTINIVAYLRGSASWLETICRKVPILGILPFAGVTDVLGLGMVFYDLYENSVTIIELSKKREKNREKRDFWTQLSQDLNNKKNNSFQANNEKLKLKLDRYNNLKIQVNSKSTEVDSQANQTTSGNTEDFTEKELKMLKNLVNLKIEKWDLKQKANTIQFVSAGVNTAMKVQKTVVSVFKIIFTFVPPVWTVLPTIKAGSYLLDAAFDVTNEVLKSKAKAIEASVNKLALKKIEAEGKKYLKTVEELVQDKTEKD